MIMPTWYVEYWTKSNRKVGIQISAWSSLDPRAYAEKMPDYQQFYNYTKLS